MLPQLLGAILFHLTAFRLHLRLRCASPSSVTHVIERATKDRLHAGVVQRLRLVTGTPDVRLYEVPLDLMP
jgi:hypothetical protein